MHYAILLMAVIAETIGTTALYASQQFTRFWPSVLVVVSYALSFYLLSLTLKYLPVGIMYALWSGMGIILIALFGYFIYGQRLDLPAILGLAMIIGGIVMIQVFSQAELHR